MGFMLSQEGKDEVCGSTGGLNVREEDEQNEMQKLLKESLGNVPEKWETRAGQVGRMLVESSGGSTLAL